MKKILVVLISIAVGMLLVSNAMAYTGSYVPGDGINNTPHDLGEAKNGMNYTADPADPLNRICIFCHAPHNTYRLSAANDASGLAAGGAGPLAPDEYTYLPLWNHTVEDPIPAFAMYDNGPGAPFAGMKASQAILNGMTPGGVSILCLSCHDGNIAVNSWGNADQRTGSMSTGTTVITDAYAIGLGDYLGNHHPIGFDYDAVMVDDPEIRLADDFNLTPTTSVRDHLFGAGNTMMECATCHSVHNKGNGGEALLWRSDQNSELCLTCHDKGLYVAP
jgi:predicted CXXCH cytochrome family protein